MKAIRRSWFHLASGAAVGRVLGFASNLLLSRWLGPTELGLFNLVTTTVQTSDTLVRCGGDFALNFELGGQPESTKTERGAELARSLAQLCSLATAFICVGLAIWVWWGHGLFPSALSTSQRLLLTGLLILMIACEGGSASAWEILLVSHRTAQLALRQGLFFPLRLLSAAVGALFVGVLGAMCGWAVIAVVQCIWLKIVLRHLWRPMHVWPLLGSSLLRLLKRGFSFYAANLLASMIFYPLLLKVATSSGLSEVGYLRVGQILQQLFAFLPATLAPIIFLKLRAESTFADQVSAMERPLRIVWFLLLELLLLYCVADQSFIVWLFGASFISALLPTRLLLITALFESLSQLVVQPILAAGQTRTYSFWQNGAAVLAAFWGWFWIPTAGLAAYLIVRLAYVIIPLIGFGIRVSQKLYEPQKMLSLALVSFGLLVLFIVQSFNGSELVLLPAIFALVFIAIAFLHRQDLFLLQKILRSPI